MSVAKPVSLAYRAGIWRLPPITTPDRLVWLAVLLAHAALLAWLLGSVVRPPMVASMSRVAISGRLVSAEPSPLARQVATTPGKVRSSAAAKPQPHSHRPSPVREVRHASPPAESATAATSAQLASSSSATASPASSTSKGDEQPVTLPRSDAHGLDNPAPAYPATSRRLHEEGRVLLRLYILADGSVGEVQLKRSSGAPRLDNAALNAVRHWRFLPARRGNQAIAYWTLQPIDFVLEN